MDVLKQHQSRVKVSVGGVDLGVFDSHDRPNLTINTVRYRPGGQVEAVATPGLPDRGTGSVSRGLPRTQVNRPTWVERQAQRGIPITVTEQPLGADMLPFGDPRVYSGVIQEVSVTDYDADSDDVRMLTITYAANDKVG